MPEAKPVDYEAYMSEDEKKRRDGVIDGLREKAQNGERKVGELEQPVGEEVQGRAT
ncbi:MAG: hypothetical protein WC451_04640 [Patescibacteria group bacterium]|jgi:hypothetical protein